MLVLPTPGGPTNNRMEPSIAALKGAYCKKLGDAGLHVIQPIVVRFERGTRLLQIQIVL